MRTVAVLLPVLLVLAIMLIVAAVRPQPQSPVESGSRLSSVRRRTSGWRWGGVVLGAALAFGAIQAGGTLGRGAMLAAPLFALGVLGRGQRG